MVYAGSARGSESHHTDASFSSSVKGILGIYWFMGAAVVGVSGTLYTRFTFYDSAAELGFAAGLQPEVSRPGADCQGRGSTAPLAGAQAWLVLVECCCELLQRFELGATPGSDGVVLKGKKTSMAAIARQVAPKMSTCALQHTSNMTEGVS